jgi:quercetin dioxygenase-like cupin family protein
MAETHHEPAGKHPPHAPVRLLDLDESADRLLEGIAGHRRRTETLAREAGVSILLMAMEAGDMLREHAAQGVVSIQLLIGHASVRAGGESFEILPGQLVMLQPGVRHDVSAIEQSSLLLTITGGEPDV